MHKEIQLFDCAIIGGGLAGLCLAIQLADKNKKVVLFDKNHYPFHKVCGEYISMESFQFLESLGLPLSEMKLPKINNIGISSVKGFMLEGNLDLGGFGISRFTLDYELSKIAKAKGVDVKEGAKVNSVVENGESNEISSGAESFTARLVCGSYGKMAPAFIERLRTKENYIGVKYHIRTDFPHDRIELHNFKDGYCGISEVDNKTYCLCYLTTADNLKSCNNDIAKMERDILMKNPFLKNIFNNSEFIYDKPLSISNVTFKKKKATSGNILLLGDAAGAIAPLCGNGMSMGMRASKILAGYVTDFLDNKISLQTLKENYTLDWNKAFGSRISAGYRLQKLFGNNSLTHLVLKLLNKTPALFKKLIALTHGNPF
ncbi:MAG: NAD(P)/FAD-dependent oxidoreductase [Bacteroidia bacterium]|nr:NAD(P)/FAD-dependent oxidoreductase [Bacteroidia bacterium]